MGSPHARFTVPRADRGLLRCVMLCLSYVWPDERSTACPVACHWFHSGRVWRWIFLHQVCAEGAVTQKAMAVWIVQHTATLRGQWAVSIFQFTVPKQLAVGSGKPSVHCRTAGGFTVPSADRGLLRCLVLCLFTACPVACHCAGCLQGVRGAGYSCIKCVRVCVCVSLCGCLCVFVCLCVWGSRCSAVHVIFSLSLSLSLSHTHTHSLSLTLSLSRGAPLHT